MRLGVTKVFPGIARRVFGTHSSFRVGWRTAGGGFISVLQGFSASFSGAFISAGALGTWLLFYEV